MGAEEIDQEPSRANRRVYSTVSDAMAKRSAGLIMYRWRESQLEVFLVHPGGPFWANKDKGAWSVPKGEYADGDEPFEAAKREFFEETGFAAYGQFLELGTVKQSGGKVVTAWAFESDCDPADLVSNRFQLEWPPRSGRLVEFPEVDRGDWFSIPAAREHALRSQEPLLDLLCAALPRSEASTE
jgi:predicted NUDIX family NTP pyrophosphohydrolase